MGSSPVSGDPIGSGGGGNGGGEPTPTNAVSVQDSFFNPTSVSVPRGDVVVWTWTGGLEHNVTWVDAPLLNSPTQAEGSHEARMPSTPGTYGYYCSIHGSPSAGMRGAIVID